MNITFLGTGIMGAPMARHLVDAGHDVTVWNRTAEKARPLGEHGASVAEDPAAATVGISANEALVALAEDHGLAYVDAPVLGTKGPAEAGELVVLASGPDAALDRLTPLFDAVGSKTIRLGAAGGGTRFKLVMNHWVLAVTDAIAETLAFAEGVDLDPASFLDAIEGGSLDIGYAHLKGPGMIAGELPVAFPLKHALKDAELILEAADRHDVDLGLAVAVRDRFARAADDGHADDDMGMVIAATRRTGGG
jgi:3-hydroxyisobutyrate dehydrogenase